MKIIYIHHADRNHDKNINRQDQDITEDGIIEAELIAKKMNKIKIKAIYTSPYLRCIHTAQIINKYINVPIYKEDFLNEMESSESWKDLQIRTSKGLDNIIKSNDEDDIVICITSGVNLSGFIYYFTKKEPDNNNPLIQAVMCSPVLFSTDNSQF